MTDTTSCPPYDLGRMLNAVPSDFRPCVWPLGLQQSTLKSVFRKLPSLTLITVYVTGEEWASVPKI